MRLWYVNDAWMILCEFLVFNCAIFLYTNLVETILPQGLDRFQALVCDKLFYSELEGFDNWQDSIFRYGKAWIYQIYFYSQPDMLLSWFPNWLFRIYNKATLSQIVSNEFSINLKKSINQSICISEESWNAQNILK